MKQELILEFQNRPFGLDYHLADVPQGVVLFLHGFKGFKDWGHFDKIAENFASRGYHFIKFNFAWNGTTPENPTEHVDLEAFGRNTFSKELDQTASIIEWMDTQPHFQHLPLTIIGHSRGGAIAVLATSQIARIDRLITWAAVSNFEGPWFDPLVEALKKYGKASVINTRTNQEMPIFKDIYDDYIANTGKLSVLKNAETIVTPSLIIHGNEDETVPIEHAISIHNAIPNSEMVIIENGDHSFGGSHPWPHPSLPLETRQVIDHSIDFMQKNFIDTRPL